MIKITKVILTMIGICSITSRLVAEQGVAPSKDAITYQYGELASELITYYTPRITQETRRLRNARQSPDLSPDHLTEKYRAAWDELTLALVTKPYDFQVMKIRDRVEEVICRTARLESVPVFAEALRRTTAKDVDQSKVIRTQEYIYSALIKITNTNSLNVILNTLDELDAVYGTNKPAITSEGVSLREKVFGRMINTNSNHVVINKQKEDERTDAWKDVIIKYRNKNAISQKNYDLLNRADAPTNSGTRVP